MQRILLILSVTQENLDRLITRLTHDNFEPDHLPSINQIPSNRINISLKISINSKTVYKIAERIFAEYNAKIEEGPMDIEPGFKIKFKQHVSRVWKESLVLLFEGWAAAHAVVGVFMLHNNLKLENMHFPNLEIFGIGSIAAIVYFVYSHTKYKKIVDD